MIYLKSYKEMRLIVSFDLPVKTKDEIKKETIFRKDLMSEGFIMMQYSVYTRFCRNNFEANKYIVRVKRIVEGLEGGEVRIIKLTNNQYENMLIFNMDKRTRVREPGICPLVIF